MERSYSRAAYIPQNLDQLISGVIFGYYIKYDRLATLINTTFQGSTATCVDIYIDLHDILVKVDRYINEQSLPIEQPLILTSGIINMVAHYRNFFRTRYSVDTVFWIVDSMSNIVGPKYYRDYRHPQLSPRMIKLRDLNIELLNMLCNYIQDVQYVSTIVDFTTKTFGISRYYNNRTCPVICISKDPFTFQMCRDPNRYVLVPKKNKDGDMSYLVSYDTATTFYVSALSKKYQQTCFNASTLTLLMALSRVPSRNIKSMYTIPNVLNVFEKIFLQTGLQYKGQDEYVIEQFCTVGRKRREDIYEIQNRLKACDTVLLQTEALLLLPEHKTFNGMVNLYDPNSVKAINNQYFKSCPLDLNVL